MIFIGFDPDLHYPAFGVVEVSFGVLNVLGAGTVKVDRAATGYEAVQAICTAHADFQDKLAKITHKVPLDLVHVACEAMKMRQRQKEAVRGLLMLQVVSGIFATAMAALYPGATVEFVSPDEWKGQVPKKVSQKRILKYLNLGYTVSGKNGDAFDVPDLGLTKAENKHVIDALGIALWKARDICGKRLRVAPS